MRKIGLLIILCIISSSCFFSSDDILQETPIYGATGSVDTDVGGGAGEPVPDTGTR